MYSNKICWEQTITSIIVSKIMLKRRIIVISVLDWIRKIILTNNAFDKITTFSSTEIHLIRNIYIDFIVVVSVFEKVKSEPTYIKRRIKIDCSQ